MIKILVSACLMGEKVRYDGESCFQGGVLKLWQDQGRIVPLCPEVAGGLPIPRPAAEITEADADQILRGRGSVKRVSGEDVTDTFVEGAEKALAMCMRHHIQMAVLKEGSPSCGVNRVNDGSFTKRKIDGRGITAQLLKRHGIAVFSEAELDLAENYLKQQEASHG